MEYLFGGCYSLTSLNISNFNTQNVHNMHSMFSDCYSLTSLDISNFNIQNIENMDYMFHNCFSLTFIDITSFSIPNTTSFSMLHLFSSLKNCTIKVKRNYLTYIQNQIHSNLILDIID